MKNNCACFTPNTGRIDDIIRLAREYQVDGVYRCQPEVLTTYNVEKSSVVAALEARRYSFAFDLETDYTDNDAEQLRTRIQAFVEMLGWLSLCRVGSRAHPALFEQKGDHAGDWESTSARRQRRNCRRRRAGAPLSLTRG